MSELAVPPGLFTAVPGLTPSGIEVTSPRDSRYNCVAWAAGESFRWWWPDAQETCYWPREVPREESLEAFVRAFGTLGYETCADASLDSAYEKLAIFASRSDARRQATCQRQLDKQVGKISRFESRHRRIGWRSLRCCRAVHAQDEPIAAA